MYKIIFLLVLMFSFTTSFGQSFEKNLDFVYKNLTETPSYKTQKQNQKKADSVYVKLKQMSDRKIPLIEEYIYFYELIDQVKDFHNEIYGNTKSFTYSDLKDSLFLKKIKSSKKHHFYPKSKINLDSLEVSLTKKSLKSYEGIYYYKSYFKIAIYKKDNELYEGIVLETKIPVWEKGETILYLKKIKNKRFRIFTRRFIDKKIISGIDYFCEGEFKTFKWQKDHLNQDYYNVELPNEKYIFKTVLESVDYLKLGSFSSHHKIIKQSKAFYNSIKNKLNSKHLIVDLRNNGGGGNKNSKPFLNLLKKYKGKIYVLMNFYTMSNAEQFILKLIKSKNVFLLGDITNGKLTYGRNYSKNKEFPSKDFRLHFTDLKDNWKEYLLYEGKGIVPNMKLNNSKDWIQQVIEKIKYSD